LIDLRSLEILARKTMSEENIRLATSRYLAHEEARRPYGSRPDDFKNEVVIIGYVQPFLPGASQDSLF
jgi:hypothetical protein